MQRRTEVNGMEVRLMWMHGNRSMTGWLVLFAAVAAVSPSALFAVTDEEIFRDFNFNLTNPGARSLGIGGAFIAVSDDATGALANPAGLMLLARPEFFTEVRDTNADDASIEQQVLNPFGDQSGITSETSPSGVFSPSFISFVHPWKRFAAGISRIEVNKARNTTASSFTIDFDPSTAAIDRELTSAGQIQTDLSVWNFSGAAKITEKISVGGTVAVGMLNIQSSVNNAFIDVAGTFLTQAPNTPVTFYDTTINDRDTDVAFNLGVLWRPHSTLSFGAVYRGGLKFEVDESFTNEGFLAPVFGFAPGTTVSGAIGTPSPTTFNTPDSYGAGVAWRPTGPLTISLDWVHIKYSDLLEGFQAGVGALTLVTIDPNGFALVAGGALEDLVKFKVEDADEIHAGAEYVFTAGSIPWAVRAGFFTDHNSRIFADFDPSLLSGAGPALFFSNNDSFPERDTEVHTTIGTGVVVKDRFQIDAAADFSGIRDEYVVSTIFRF